MTPDFHVLRGIGRVVEAALTVVQDQLLRLGVRTEVGGLVAAVNGIEQPQMLGDLFGVLAVRGGGEDDRPAGRLGCFRQGQHRGIVGQQIDAQVDQVGQALLEVRPALREQSHDGTQGRHGLVFDRPQGRFHQQIAAHQSTVEIDTECH